MPIHLRAAPGDYAPAVLLPGDPRRAAAIAERFLDDARPVNEERGLLGFTGTFEGRPVSVQATGMGCPSAAIVVEELIGLGARRLVRVGTCGALHPGLGLGDVICAAAATPADATTLRYTGGEPHAPTADFELVHVAVHLAKHAGGPRLTVGPIVSSDVFYDPDDGQAGRWAARGHLAVEMESSVLFTIAALRGVAAAALLVVSDLVLPTRQRIADDALAGAVDCMAELALRTALSEPKPPRA